MTIHGRMRPKSSERKNVAKQLSTTDDIRLLGTILSVWAHPDDETFTSAGLLATAAANGQRVIIVTATKGEFGVQDETRWPQASLGAIRADEIRAALAVLGISEQRWLGYSDGSCADVDKDEAVSRLASIIEECNPDSIITFGPDGLTGHPDHKAVGDWVLEASQSSSLKPAVYQVIDCQEHLRGPYKRIAQQMNYYFADPKQAELSDCDIALRLSDELAAKKCDALRAHASQYTGLFERFPEPDIRLAFSIETFVRAK